MKLLQLGFVLRVACLLSGSFTSHAALVIDALETEKLITFDSSFSGVLNGQFSGGGFSTTPAAGQLHSDSWSTQGWASGGSVPFGGTATTGEFARGTTTAAVTSTGVYANGATDRQILLQGGNTAANMGESITLKLENETGATITGWTIGYDAFLRNDSITDSWLIVELSANGTQWLHTGVFYNIFINNSGLSDALGWRKVGIHLHTFDFASGAPFPLTVDPGSNFYIRWRTYLSSGHNIASPRDEWGIDNIRITAIPEPSVWLLSVLAGPLVLRRFRRGVLPPDGSGTRSGTGRNSGHETLPETGGN